MSTAGGESRAGTTGDAAVRGGFPATHWSVVLAAGGGASASAARALETLCRGYWSPVYAWVRRRGHGVEEARDLTQGFFATLLARDALGTLDAPRGRFRWFLLAALKHHLADERARARALKRGGGQVPWSLDETDAEGRFLREAVDGQTPDQTYERRWAWTVLEEGLARLREEFVLSGRGAWFDHLQPCLAGEDGTATYAEIARELGATDGAVKMAVQRARRRLREILRSVVAATVEEGADGEAELRDLVAVLREAG